MTEAEHDEPTDEVLHAYQTRRGDGDMHLVFEGDTSEGEWMTSSAFVELQEVL